MAGAQVWMTGGLSLKLAVVVRDHEDAKRDVLQFLEHFEKLYRGTVDTHYRTIDGEVTP